MALRGVVRGALFRWGVGGLAALVLMVLTVTQGPRLLRRLVVFRVAQVEVVGTRYLAPHEVLGLSGIGEGSSLFDDPEPWLAALRAHPLVEEVTLEREFPGTLIFRIVEVAPIALVGTPLLRPVDARGRFLPIEPAVADLDLPVIVADMRAGGAGMKGAGIESGGAGEDAARSTGTGSTGAADAGANSAELLTDPGALALVKALDRLGRLAPGLLARVSAIAPLAGGDLRLLLREPAQGEALLPGDFTAIRIEQLRLTLADLEARRELPRARRIDVRFGDQVVVSLTSS